MGSRLTLSKKGEVDCDEEFSIDIFDEKQNESIAEGLDYAERALQQKNLTDVQRAMWLINHGIMLMRLNKTLDGKERFLEAQRLLSSSEDEESTAGKEQAMMVAEAWLKICEKVESRPDLKQNKQSVQHEIPQNSLSKGQIGLGALVVLCSAAVATVTFMRKQAS